MSSELKIPQPTLIAVKQKEHMVVASWRDSPGLGAAPVRSGVSPPLSSCSPPLKPQTPNLAAKSPAQPAAAAAAGGASGSKRRRRGKSKTGMDAGEEPAKEEAWFVRVALGAHLNCEFETVKKLVKSSNFQFTDLFQVPAPRALQIKRGEGEEGSDISSPQFAGATPVADAQTGSALPPEMALPPSIPESLLELQPLAVFAFSNSDTADQCVKAIASAFPTTIADKVSRKADHRSATLVVKALPVSVRPEKLHDELLRLHVAPNYVRFHRTERGMFRSVIFVKFSSKGLAEKAKMELDRATLGGRPLRVEFKKKVRGANGNEDGLRLPLATPGSGPAESPMMPPAMTTPQVKPAAPPNESLTPSQRPVDMQNKRAKEEHHLAVCGAIDVALTNLKTNRDLEGLSYQRALLTREEQKHLRVQAATHPDFNVDVTADGIIVKKRASPPPAVSRSPALRPSSNSTSPAFGPANPPQTPPMAGQDINFRGMEAWKKKLGEEKKTGLPILRVRNPGDAPPFPAGRGRPIPPPS